MRTNLNRDKDGYRHVVQPCTTHTVLTHNYITTTTAIFQDNWGKLVPECLHSRLYWSKNHRRGGDNWSYKTCKAPVKSSPSTNQRPGYCRPDALPVAQPTVSEHWREKASYSIDLLILKLQAHLGVFLPIVFDHKRLLGTLGEGCQAFRQPSNARTYYTPIPLTNVSILVPAPKLILITVSAWLRFHCNKGPS